MPDRTPAEELTAAADKLDALLSKLGDRWVVDVAVLTNSFSWLGPSHDALTATWPQAAYIAAMNPDVGRTLAALLRRHGQIAVGWMYTEEVFPEELRLARAILGSADAAPVREGNPPMTDSARMALPGDSPTADNLHSYWFTFGSDHLGGRGLRRYVVVRAASSEEARQQMMARFQYNWAYQYDSAERAGVDRHGLIEIDFRTGEDKLTLELLKRAELFVPRQSRWRTDYARWLAERGIRS